MKKVLIILLGGLALLGCKKEKTETFDLDADTATTVMFDVDTAMSCLKAQCDFGARTPGSNAHKQCGDYILQKFQTFGLVVSEQTGAQTMWDGKTFTCRNLIARYNPDATDRIVLCTHYDSRPWADQDQDKSKQTLPVMAANDGASGVAVLLEVARKLAELKPNVGIDFVCFDLEDYGAPHGSAGAPSDGSDWCVGSRFWASQAQQGVMPQFGVLLDMVGGRNARFAKEHYSMQYAAPVVARVWSAANTAGYKDYFTDEDGGAVTDDHLNLNAIGIPTIDIIPYNGSQGGFGPTWHTSEDTPENIDPATLRAVGQTLLQLIADY